MPWHIEPDHTGCSGYAVVKDQDGSVAGCHPTQAKAKAQLAALYANEPEMAMQPDMPMPDPQVTQDEFDVAEPGMELLNPEADAEDYAALYPVPTDLTDVIPCWGVACIEGVPDGADPKRMWAPGSLVFAPLPWSLKWQAIEDEAHEGSVVVGRVDAAWRDGALIRWAGVLDAGGESGREVARQIGQQFVHGVSIKADDVTEAETELIYPAPPMMDPTMIPTVDGEPIEPAEPVADCVDCAEECEFCMSPKHPGPCKGTKRSAGKPTVTRGGAPKDWKPNKKYYPKGLPGQSASAQGLVSDGMMMDMMAEPELCIYHHGRIRSLTIVAEAAYVEATISLGESPFQPITTPTEDPMAELEAIAAEPEPAPAITAASWTVTIPDVWPEHWFAQPTEEELAMCAAGGGAVQITPDGRVFGLLAPAGVDHRAFRASGERVQVPRNIDYSEWQNKACIVAGADGMAYKINAGTVTYDCGHPSPFDPRRADPSFASQHYDNSCSVAMRARAGEHPRYGTWFAGALAHGLTADALERIMGCALSGDWQGGKLKAALLVPCEGFPTRGQASVRQKMGSLVASSVPIHYQAPPPPPTFDALFDLIASATGRGPEARFRELADMRFDEIAQGR
jgi:hypothetical protein